MKIFKNKKVSLAVVTALILLSTISFLQSCSKNENIIDNYSISDLKKEYNLTDAPQYKSKVVAKFNNLDSARQFLSKIAGKHVYISTTNNGIKRIKNSSLETYTSSSNATVVNNPYAFECTVTTPNALGPYFPGAKFVVTIDYKSLFDPTIKNASFSGLSWGFDFIGGGNVSYRNGVFTYGVVGKTVWAIEILGKIVTYSQYSSIEGWANIITCTGFSTATVSD